MTSIGLFSSNVFLGTPAPDGGRLAVFTACGRQRVHMPQVALAANGVDATSYVYLTTTDQDGAIAMSNDGEEWHTPDVVVLHSWYDGDVVARAVACGQRVVMDLDDDHMAIPGGHRSHGQIDPLRYARAMAACSAITVSTQRLVELTERYDKPTYLLRNCVDLDQWAGVAEKREPADRVRYAWVGDVRFRADDLGVLRDSGFWPFVLAHDDVMAVHLGDVQGARSFRSAMRIPRVEADGRMGKLEVLPLVHIAEYAGEFAKFDVCVIPLEDHPLNHAKSWLRGLECCAAGVPFAVSAGFVEYEQLSAEGAVFTTLHELGFEVWMDPELRAFHASHNLKAAESWSIQNRWPAWRDTYEEIAR